MLYLCATPIGNLGDITLRVLDTLRSVDIIAAEDTRQTIKLLNHFEIKTPMISYHEHNKVSVTPGLIKRLQSGEDVALVTDAGTPAISDPGEDLVRACRDVGINVTSLPGATAAITGLTLSGMNARRFTYEGFLPRDKGEIKEVLSRLSDTTYTTILYEAPHRLLKTLGLLLDVLDDKRRITICKELTKKHENATEFGSALEAIEYYKTHKPQGEFVVIIQGADPDDIKEANRQKWAHMSIEDHMQIYIDDGMDKKSAMKKVAADRGVPKRDIYNALL